MADVQVKTELTLDENATDVLERVQDGFEDLSQEAEETKSSFKDFATQFAAMFAAVNLTPFLTKMKDVVTSFIDVGSEAFDLEQNIAGMLAGMTGNEWGVARAYAEDLNDEFNSLSVGIGQAKDDIETGHDALVTFLGGTSRAFQVAGDNMQNLTTIANVQGLSVQELGSQYGKMAAGFVSLESPVFNLLKTTGIFSSDLTKINQEWQKLTQEERIKRLTGAVASVADNLSKAPPTLSDMVTSMKAVSNEFMETFGKSAMSGFMGGLSELRGDLMDTRGDLKDFAREVGKEVGSFIGDIVKNLRTAFQYIQTHGDEIKEAVKEGFQFARETVSWILEHKTELMLLGGGLMASRTGLGGGLISGVGGLAAGALGGLGNAVGERQAAQGMRMLTAPSTAKAVAPTVPIPKLDLSGLNESQKQIAQINQRVLQNLANTHGIAGQMLQKGATDVQTSVRTLTTAQQAIVRNISATRTLAGRFGTAMNSMVQSGSPAVQMGARLAKGIGSLAGAIIAGGPPAWALTAAVTAAAGGFIYLNEKISEAEEERNKIVESGLKEYESLSQTMGVLNKEQIKRMDELREAAAKAAADKLIPERAFEQFEAMDNQRREMLKSLVRPMEDAFSNVEKISQKVEADSARFEAAVEKFGAASSAAALEEEKYMEGQLALAQAEEASVALITDAFANSWKAHNESSMKYILGVVNRSEDMRDAFIRSADMSAEGFSKMISVAEQMGPEFERLITGLKGRRDEEIERMAKSSAPQVNFNGGQVFKIQQNFRNIDADRVAIAFEDRFTKAAISRVQAVTSTPFGT